MNPVLMAMLGPLAEIIKKLIPDPQAQAQAQLDLAKMAQAGQLAELNAAVQVILADANGNMLQRSWRPILMLTFGALIVARWFGWSAPNLAPEEYAHLWNIVEVAIGGGVIGRTIEKAAPAVAGAFKK
jgi:hypothetical protein